MDTTTESTRIALTDDVPHFHRHPPYSPRHLFDRTPVLLTVIALATALAVAAAMDGGHLLLRVDEPVARWVADHRTDEWGTFFAWASRMGDNAVVFPLGLAIAIGMYRRCRFLSYALVVAIAVRPGFEYLLKAAIDRQRPDIAPLAHFRGPSHPSGHPLAAVSVWGLMPPVVALLGAGRKLWWATVSVVMAIIVMVAAARVYRGAHWLTDVTASLLWGALFLVAVELVYDHVHDRFHWHDPSCPPRGTHWRASRGARDARGASGAALADRRGSRPPVVPPCRTRG